MLRYDGREHTTRHLRAGDGARCRSCATERTGSASSRRTSGFARRSASCERAEEAYERHERARRARRVQARGGDGAERAR